MVPLLDSLEKNQDQDQVQIKIILVPIDGSSNSMKAAKYAIEIAKLQNAQILCVHVITSLPYDYALSGPCVEQYLEDVENQCESWFRSIIQMANNTGIKNIKTTLFKDIRSTVDAIIKYSDDNSVDLIVTGTRGRTGVQRVLIGSVASGIVQHAHCTVLLVR